LPHPSHTEYYVCINSAREGDEILFTHEGGIDVGDVDAKALKLAIPVGKGFPSRDAIKRAILTYVPEEKKDTLVDFLTRLYSVYVDLHFAYLEINPLICLDGQNGNPPTIHYLDMAAKLDQVCVFGMCECTTAGLLIVLCAPRRRNLSVGQSGRLLATFLCTMDPRRLLVSLRIVAHPWVRPIKSTAQLFINISSTFVQSSLPHGDVISPRRRRTFRNWMEALVHP
jgi:hypothetical protein